MSDTRTASPFASLTPADLLLFALDHTPNKAKKEVCLYVRENLSKAPMFHGMRTSSNTFLDGLTFRNRVPTAFKNSQPAMNAFINTLLKETHIQLLADKDVHHEDPFKNAGEFDRDTVRAITDKLLSILKGKPDALAAHVMLFFYNEFTEGEGKKLHNGNKDKRKAHLDEVLGHVLEALSESDKTKAGTDAFLAFAQERKPQANQADETPEPAVEPQAGKPASARPARKTKTSTNAKSRVAKLVSAGFDSKKSNPATESLLTTAANSLPAEPAPAEDTHKLRSKIEAASIVAAVPKTTTADVKEQKVSVAPATEETQTSVGTAPPAPELEPAPYVAPDNFPIENEFSFDDKPVRGKTRSLGYIRQLGKFTNLSFVANWSDTAKRFYAQNFNDTFPRYGAVSLDFVKARHKLSDGSFYVLDWSSEIFQDNTNEKGESRSDYTKRVEFDEIYSQGALRPVEQFGGFIVVYPDLRNDESLNLQGKVLIRFQPSPESGDEDAAALLRLSNVQVLLSAGKRLYGPMNLLEDSLHRPYVNLKLRSGSRVINGFDLSSGSAPVLTVEQSCISNDLRVNVKVDLIFVNELQRCAFDMLSDEALLSQLYSSISDNRAERERFEQWAQVQLDSNDLFCENDEIRESRRNRIRSLLQQTKTNDLYFDSMIGLLSKSIGRRIDDPVFFERLVTQLEQKPDLMKRLESHRVIANQLDYLRGEVSKLEKNRDTLKQELERQRQKERREAEEAHRTLLADNKLLAEECEKRREALGLMGDIEKLRQQKEVWQSKVDSLQTTADALNEKHSKITSEINAIDDHLKEAVQKAHAYAFDGAIASKLLQAASDWESGTERTNFEGRARVVATLPRSVLTGQDLADALVAEVQSYRAYDRNTILNFFILLTQNFLTVFSGEPGSGKTSICEILASVLGLRSMHKVPAVTQSGLWKNPMAAQRFLTVPVERGWTSKRDFIGYYNPLSKTFESTDARRREAFAELDAEYQRGFDDIPFVILLDEANLSPMEYYWGDFMRICDNRTRVGESVSFGGESTYSIPDTLRFLATINNDFTTENLSPRLLDRANIVKLPEQDWMPLKQLDDQQEQPIISWSAMRTHFGPRTANPNDKLSREINALLDDIFAEFKEQLGISVSMRTRLAIQDYVSAGAAVFMGESEPAYRTAIDFAVVQRLMPRIDGNGKEYRERLEAMQSIFDGNGLDRSRTELAELFERGEKSMGWYRFF